MMDGPETKFAQKLHAEKYRSAGESFRDYGARVAGALADDDAHFHRLAHLLWSQKFLPGGRIQSAIGSPRDVTAFNCFVSGSIPDSMDGIMDIAKDAALTLRMGGGIGFDFSTLRPRGTLIKTLDSGSSGPISFMEIFNAVCSTIHSAGSRRGAMMGILRVDHPDIEEFIDAKSEQGRLTFFNLSVAMTDEFMNAVSVDGYFDLVFDERVYKKIKARPLYDKIMRSTWDGGEPGILFIDTINKSNNLSFYEDISATNPCSEQPLPPYGACLLGSFNLTKYIKYREDQWMFGMSEIKRAIPDVVRAMDNVIDNTIFPLPQQEVEAKLKRRIGIGVTGAANAGEMLGMPYGSDEFVAWLDFVLGEIANGAYMASANLAKEKGGIPFTITNAFMRKLRPEVQDAIAEHGLRNSHLLSIAPTGTISMCADNISSGVEPVYAHEVNRIVITEGAPKQIQLIDWAAARGVRGKTADECSVDDHLKVLQTATNWVDSSVSKTINVGEHVTWEEFKNIYMRAWQRGCKGLTTFRAAGKRLGIMQKAESCSIDPETGKKTCDS